ncbi:MAG: hypothetical protein PF541_06085 [Prolixibacteraceae bacterium]|jgi:hypothetical protein|nr:hypothetical protein [Prolixibacteraceae bacterium]
MNRIKSIKIIVLLTLLFVLSVNLSYGQNDIGGPHKPLVNSTHTYAVTMSDGANDPSWYFYPSATDIGNIDLRTGISLGAGTKPAGIAKLDIYFASPLYKVDSTYTLVYKEIEPSSLSCVNYKFYDVTIQAAFDVDINTSNFPAAYCPFEPESFKADPTGQLSATKSYEIDLVSSYELTWNFSYEFLTTHIRSGWSSATIVQIRISAAGMSDATINVNSTFYESVLANIPETTSAVTIEVDYTFDPGSAQDIKLTISNMSGEHEEEDLDDDPQIEVHQISKIPAPSAITSID